MTVKHTKNEELAPRWIRVAVIMYLMILSLMKVLKEDKVIENRD